MGRPVAIRKLIIEINMQNLDTLRDSLKHYHKYLQDCIEYEHKIVLSEAAIKRRMKYIESFLNSIELEDEALQV